MHTRVDLCCARAVVENRRVRAREKSCAMRAKCVGIDTREEDERDAKGGGKTTL